MKLSDEQVQQLQEKLAAEKNPAEAAKIAKEYGIDITAEDMEAVLAQVSGGGSYGQLDLTDFQYTAIRGAYERKGPNEAFVTCIYLIPSPICWDIVGAIEEQIKEEKKKKK